MDKGIKVYAGLDVHKDTIAVAATAAGSGRRAGRWCRSRTTCPSC